MYTNLTILAAFAFLYGTFAKGIERTWIGGPIIFTVVGLMLGPLGIGVLNFDISGETLRLLAELTLAMVLFNDAASINLAVIRDNLRIPRRVLSIGLPLTILLGFGVGVLLFDNLTYYEVAILATMLAATDAALGKQVITNKKVPARMRESLNVESGLNDGICVPILFIFIALAVNDKGEAGGWHHALLLVVEEIGIGLAVGLALASFGAWALKLSTDRNWLSRTWMQVTAIALSVACFATAQSMGGSGFIAAFCGGLLFGKLLKTDKKALLHAAEGAGDTFALLTWVVFGAAVIGNNVDHYSWTILLYSVLSLTLIRMVPVFLSLAGTGEPVASKLFLGWFGPRGLASIVFIIIVLNEHLAGGKTLALVVISTVCLSIIAHGISALPLAEMIGKRLSKSN